MKNNFLSLMGMRLRGRRMNDPEITRKSPGNHPVITPFSRLITSTLLLLFTFAIGNVWGAYYTPTADEVIILNEVYKADVADAGYSTHAAIAWAGTASTNSKTAGDPNNGGAATSSNVPCYSVKGNGGAKNITISITGCSKIIIYHEKHSSRYVELRSGSKTGTLIGKGAASTYYTEIALDGSTLYDLFLHGTTGSDDQDLNVYAVKLIKAPSGDPVPVTGITITPSPAAIKVGKTITLTPTITPSNATDKAVTWAVTSGSSYASVTDAGVVTGLEEGTAVITATAHDGSGVTQTVTVNVEECPTSGTLFSMVITDPDGTTYTDVTESASKEIGATYTGGKAYATSTSTSKRSPKITGTDFDFNVSSGGSVAVKVELDCPLAEGDIITFTSTHDKNFYIRKVVGTDLHTTASLKLEIPSGSALIGEEVFYIMRTNSACSFRQINIVRPVYRTITLEYADGTTPDGSISAVEGASATKPTEPTWEHHRFAGWYNGETPYDWTANVTGDLTLTAHWTQLYTISFNNGGGSGDAPAPIADKAQGETFEVPENTFTAPAGQVFDYWNDGTNDYNPGDTYTVGTNNVTLTAVWRTPSTMYAITKGAHEHGDFTIDPASQEAGEVVTLEATPDDGYLFGGWEVVKTEDASATGITVDANGQFTMQGYAVTVNATFVADPRKKILYLVDKLTGGNWGGIESDKLYAALKDDYNVTVAAPAGQTLTDYDLIVLHESIGGTNSDNAVVGCKTTTVPVLNTKSYFYNDGRWGWGTPNAGQSVKGATLNSSYCNIADHPLFDGVTMTAGFFEITDDAAAKCMQPVGSFTSGKEGYTLATTPNNGEGNGCAIHELTPAQRGASAGKYLMISVSNSKLDALNANGQKLFQNAAAYLIDGSASWTPIAVPTTPEIAGTTAYVAGGTIELTASATGTIAAATYAWYKGDTWTAAEAAGAIQAAATATEGGNAYAKAGCVVGDAGKYWCVISNGTDCDVTVSVDVTVAQTYTVNYLPGEGTGDPIVDDNATVVADCPVSYIAPAGKMFYGWKDGEGNDIAVGAPVTKDMVLTAQWGAIMVAKIGETLYPSLEAALDHAAEGEIVLLQDIDVDAQVEIFAGVTATIDLAGYKIVYTGTETLPSGVILIHNGGSLTIKDSRDPDAGSVVAGEKAYAAIALTKAGDNAANPATLIINGGTYTGLYYAITGNGARHNTNITINAGTFTATANEDNLAIFHPQNGTLTINGGTFTGYASAIEMRAGTLVINDGTFKATATEFSCNPSGSGSTTVGAAIAIAQHTTKEDISVTINGGTFNGVKAINEANPQGNPDPAITMSVTGGDFTGDVSTVDVDHFVSGGSFDHPVLNEQCAENFVPKDNGDGTYGVTPKDGVCLIWGDVAKNSLTRNTAKSQYNGTLANTDVRDNTITLDELVGHKFQAGGYLSLALEGQDFKAGDQVAIFVTSLNGLADKLRVYNKNEAKDANVVAISDENMTTRVNKATLAADASTIYLRRGDDYNSWNPCVAYVAVYRAMMPKLTAITINGRDGVIDPLDDKHFTVTIPNDANLASLTVEPTIVRNAPHATTPEQVMTNSGAWVLTADGDNTYRIMDKDGDYTDYTITLIRDVLKHTVSFNTHGGSAIDPVEVVDGQKLTAAPADPTKDENTFKFWSEDEDGAEVDVTTVQINTDKEFHAVWEAEPAGIKLFDGDGNLNTTNFVSPAKATITIDEVEHVCLEQFSSNRTSLGGATPADMVKYDVTTDEAKIKMTFYNNNSGIKKAILYKYEEGGTPEKIEIEVPGQEIFTTEYYTFNSSKNRSFYVCMNDRSNIRVLQVKVIDNGANPVKQFGQVGYSLNLNKGRFYAKAAVEKNFEGFTFTPSSEYKVYNNSNLATTSANSFTIASPAVMSVTRSGGKYYVYQDPADKGTLYSGNAEIELNTTGTWYISSETSGSAASFSTIEFLAPKCEKPTIETQPATKQTFDPGNLTATVVATVADGGTLKYQWYDAATDEEVENATEATLTTTTEGTYYVIVTNTLADHRDNFIKSAEATLGYRVTNDATLSALSASAGTLNPAFDKDVEEYRVDLPEGTAVVPTLIATATMDGYANVDINNADAFVDYEATSTVVVTSEDGTANKTYTVLFKVAHQITTLVDVTESTTWDWTTITNDVDGNAIGSNGPTLNGANYILANYIQGDNWDKIEGNNGAYAIRNGSDKKVYQGASLHFHTTKAGLLTVKAGNEGHDMVLKVANAGRDYELGALASTRKDYMVYVEAGDVTVYNVPASGTSPMRVEKMTFTVKETPDYTRNVSNNIGTLCVDHNVLVGGAMGATFYQIASRNELYDYKIDFEEVLPNEELKAGEPYIFKSNTGKIELFYGTTVADAPVAVRGMHGWFSNTDEFTMLEITEENKSDILYIAQNKLWNCEDLVTSDLKVVNNCAYIVMSEVPTYADYVASQNSNNAPRRRVTLSKDEAQVATGMGEIEASETPMKVMINGQLFIIRGEKMFDVTGKLVK